MKVLLTDKWQFALRDYEFIDNFHIYFKNVKEIIKFYKDNKIDFILANNYNAQNFIEKNEVEFVNNDLKFIVNSRFTIETLTDKKLFINFMLENGFEDFIPAIYEKFDDIKFPCVVKPIRGGAGRGVFLAKNFDEIKNIDRDKFFINEFLEGCEYAHSIFMVGGEVVESFNYKKVVDKNLYILQEEPKNQVLTTKEEPKFLNLFVEIIKKIAGENGDCQCSFNYKIKNNRPVVFEINPRMGYTLAQQKDDFKQFLQSYSKIIKENEIFLTKQYILKNGKYFFKKVKNFPYDNVFIFKKWRIFWANEGDCSPELKDFFCDSSIPSYIIDILYKFETSDILLSTSFKLKNPLKNGFFDHKEIKYYDIFLKNIPFEHGIASGVVLDEKYEILQNTPFPGKSLKITIHRNLIKKTATPMHELFHLYQYSYCHFNNMWFMEGLARWSQTIILPGIGQEEPLPQTFEELDSLIHKLHDAEFFWNRLIRLCDKTEEFEIPAYLRENTELQNNQKYGSNFIHIFLNILKKEDKNIEKKSLHRKIKSVEYWPRFEKRNANNNKYIFKAILDTVNELKPPKNRELDNFIKLITPFAKINIQDYQNASTQWFLKTIYEYTQDLVVKTDDGTFYSEFYDPISNCFSCEKIEFDSKDISSAFLCSFGVLKRMTGDLIFKNCHNLDDLEGLNNLISIDGSVILENIPVENINNFEKLKEIKNGSLKIISCEKLKNIDGFGQLKIIKKDLLIKNCKKLQKINGFNSLESLLNVEINGTMLEDCNFLSNVFRINKNFKGFVKIINSKLKNIEFFTGILTIDSSCYLHKNNLSNLKGFENLKSIGGSLSLSSNNLENIESLRNLEIINGALLLDNNKLKNLFGLENLKSLTTKKWGDKNITIQIYLNKELENIESLKNIRTKDNYIIFYIDNYQKYIIKPDIDSNFHKNILEIHDRKNGFLVPAYKFAKKEWHDYSDFRATTHNKILTQMFDFELEDPDILIISFTGAFGNLGGMFYNKYNLILNNIKTHKIFIMDPNHTWYNGGIVGVTKNLDQTVEFIENIKSQKKYKKIICTGTSMGGYASLLIGNMIGADEALVFAPQTYLDEKNRQIYGDKRWAELIEKFPKDIKEEYLDLNLYFNRFNNKKTKFNIHYAALNKIDMTHINHLPKLGNFNFYPYQTDDHYLTVVMHKDGALEPIILNSLGVSLD